MKVMLIAEYVAFQPHVQFPLHWNRGTGICFVVKAMHVQNKRNYSFEYCKMTQQLWNICKFSDVCLNSIKACNHHRRIVMKGRCLGTLISDESAPSYWIIVGDQVLLMTSIILAYMAGVIPSDKYSVTSCSRILNDSMLPEDNSFSGRLAENDNEVNLKFAWNDVKDKLMDSLNAVESRANFENCISDQYHANKPLSLSALAAGPKYRLLWASFQWLKTEVDNISRNTTTSRGENLQIFLYEIIRKSSFSIYFAWLKEEIQLSNSKFSEDLLSMMFEKLNRYELIVQNIRRSGKEDLYAELISVLSFGCLQLGWCYNIDFFTMHVTSILEDLVITLADGIAGMYLELISVDSSMSNEMNSLGLNLCTLSTRALQRLRNEVALNQWLYQNMEAIVSMYEDRFDLHTLQIQLIEEPSKAENEKSGWWKKFVLGKSEPVVSPLRVAAVNCICIPVKRTKELRGLMGWRYYFSLFLELADITMPLIRKLFAQISNAISFFLVYLIGRSLGLIYSGIRQSLRWK